MFLNIALSRELPLVVLLGLIPLLLLREWIVVVAWIALAVLAVIVDIVLAASPRALTVERVVPFQVRLSEEAQAELIVRNGGRRRARGVIHDAWQPSAGARNNVQKVNVRPGGARRYLVSLKPTRRGTRTAEHITVRLFGPLGLGARQFTFRASSSLRVLPEFRARKHLPSRLARLRELDGGSAVNIRGEGTEFDSLREYVDGDDVRSIDWRGTARSREIVVRTWRPERDRRVVIVVDTSRTSAPRVNDEPRLDSYIEAALLLGALASKAGDRVELIAYDRVQRARVSSSNRSNVLREFASALSTVEPVLVEADWTGLTSLIRTQISGRSLVVFLTNSDITSADVGILTSIGSLTKSHLVVLASVADPEVAELALQRDSSTSVYDAAAAERAILDDHAASAMLSGSGVVVLSALPADLAPRLSDKYLDLKAAGQL
ncbi:DUF58 domain-containing protein [Timonella senegalensis]|uniref:DUF58 domain-containing protein n=1 Tax=Timonella senegalensis TaxID=1465825 RepID=UPI002FDEC101